MENLEIVALYVALNMLLAPYLMLRVGQERIAKKVSLGDGGEKSVLARMRAHANFTENAPLALIGLFALAMMSGVHAIALHIFGAAFFLGRLAHAHGMAAKNAGGKGRTLGALVTLLTYLGQALYLIYLIAT